MKKVNTFPSTAPTPPTCVTEEALVNGVVPIPDSQITATSVFDSAHNTTSARLLSSLNGGAWCGSTNDTNMYIMVCKVLLFYCYMVYVIYVKNMLEHFQDYSYACSVLYRTVNNFHNTILMHG